MNEFAKALLELSKECTTEYVKSSRCITADPCWVFNITCNPTNAGAATTAYLRNGELISSNILLTIVSQYFYPNLVNMLPIYFNKGLYIELNTNLTGVSIQYLIY